MVTISRGAWVAPFGDEERTFDLLALGAWRKLQAATDFGFWVLLQRLVTRQCGVPDYREVIRIGLIGGGASEAEALQLVKAHFDPAPLGHYLPLAIDIMNAAAWGADDLKKAQAGLGAQNMTTTRED